MSPEQKSPHPNDLEKAGKARRDDLRTHFEAYLSGLNEVERQEGDEARRAHRIYQARLYEIERQQLSLIK